MKTFACLHKTKTMHPQHGTTFFQVLTFSEFVDRGWRDEHGEDKDVGDEYSRNADASEEDGGDENGNDEDDGNFEEGGLKTNFLFILEFLLIMC